MCSQGRNTCVCGRACRHRVGRITPDASLFVWPHSSSGVGGSVSPQAPLPLPRLSHHTLAAWSARLTARCYAGSDLKPRRGARVWVVQTIVVTGQIRLESRGQNTWCVWFSHLSPPLPTQVTAFLPPSAPPFPPFPVAPPSSILQNFITALRLTSIIQQGIR